MYSKLKMFTVWGVDLLGLLGKQCCCDVASIYIIFVDLIDR